ncbi:MAG: galactokinase, partial [Bacteroidota bacterium]|nr:galactokinase [Bacteroidota bacterium]
MSKWDNKHTIEIISPGRINIIGEHLDYNGGDVLPMPINLTTQIHITKTDGIEYEVKSLQFENKLRRRLKDDGLSEEKWHNYVIGVVSELYKIYPNKISGFKAHVSGSIPVGAGLSSSASLTCGLLKALNSLFDLGISKKDMALIAQKVEHQYAGTPCGIMDQYAILFGKQEAALYLNCQTLEYKLIDISLTDFQWVLFNSNIKHNLSDSAYLKRVKETKKALSIIQSEFPHFTHLAKVSLESLKKCKTKMDNKVFNRALYVIEEQNRVEQVLSMFAQHKFHEVGEMLYQSHHGLSSLYDVSCAELDYLVDITRSLTGVLGARMMG